MNRTTQMSSLGEVVVKIDTFPWSDAVYIEGDFPWSANAKCIVLDPNDIESEEQEVPTAAASLGLQYMLSISDIQNVKYNAQSQKQDISKEELLEAVNYYYRNDAYKILPE